jgi:c-di-GMP-binding flagellar brake protein YcgR
MVEAEKERRRFQRIFFSLEDGIQGTFTFSDLHKGIFTAYILNLSEGGVGFVLNKKEDKKIEKGNGVILTQIRGIRGLEPRMNIEAEVRWILDKPALEFLGFGCEFLRVPAPLQAQIRACIDSLCSGKIGSRPEGQNR